MKKVITISQRENQFECLFDEGAENPYRLYKLEWKQHANGYPYRSKKLIEKLPDIQSVMYRLYYAVK